MKIYLGADHNGFELKEKLEAWLKELGYTVIDQGNQKRDPEDDFPQFAARVATAMLGSSEPDPKGILICGSGQGMCIAANRFKGIRASLAWNENEAKLSRNDGDSNILCLAASDLKSVDDAKNIVKTWLDTPFAGAARYVRRIKDLDELV
jgi:ribose 5-phosphate isomerase B